MKGSRAAATVLAALSFVGLLFCLAGYLYIQPRLVPSLEAPTPAMRTFGSVTVPALLVAGIYHVVLLVGAFRSLADRERTLLHSVYIVALVLSGVNLVTDVTLLSDIGKEYARWDVTEQWWILYAFTALHLAVVLYGFVSSARRATAASAATGGAGSRSDALFLSMNQIAIVCGVLGIAAVVALPGMVPERFRTLWVLFLSVLSLFPLAVFAGYLAIRGRERPFAAWFDEKQMADMAAGALVSVLTVTPLLLVVSLVESFAHIDAPRSLWLMLVLFVHLLVMSAVALSRSRAP